MATKPQLTEFVTNIYSPAQRLYGSKMYCADLDNVWYNYQNSEPNPVALADYKHATVGKINNDSSIHLYQVMGNRINIPVYVIIYWLELNQVPQYYVLPANLIASKILGGTGTWMTPKSFSKFQHEARNNHWNRFEMCPDNKWGAKTLDDLPDQAHTYNLPEINLIIK